MTLKTNIDGKSRRNFLGYLATGISIVLGSIGLTWWLSGSSTRTQSNSSTPTNTTSISVGDKYFLPLPKFNSGITVEEAMAWRRSVREYKDVPLTVQNLSMLLWSAQGINELKYGFRTVPSAGGLYPLEIYVVVSNHGVVIDDSNYLPYGSYLYDHRDHSIKLVRDVDLREELARVSLNQEWVRKAPVNIIVFAVYERTTEAKYGERGNRYVHMEDGHVGQNTYLMAAALHLGTVVIGAFSDDEAKQIVGAREKEQPLYVQPVGVPQEFYQISERDITEYYNKVRKSE